MPDLPNPSYHAPGLWPRGLPPVGQIERQFNAKLATAGVHATRTWLKRQMIDGIHPQLFSAYERLLHRLPPAPVRRPLPVRTS